jgi:hypothetical protein
MKFKNTSFLIKYNPKMKKLADRAQNSQQFPYHHIREHHSDRFPYQMLT